MADIDDLFDYDAGLDDVIKNLPTVPNNDTTTKENNNTTETTQVLGLDADLKISKQRAPVAKLDATRLLSQNGIPKLRQNAKTKLKFKGKGHEFSDLGRLLNFYQLWLDDLYPRAKFADGLAMIEKLGHSKRIQIMRKEWIDEERPNHHSYGDYNAATSSAPEDNQVSADSAPANAALTTDDVPRDDDLDILLAEAEVENSAIYSKEVNSSGTTIHRHVPVNDGPPDDELDMLLAEAENIG